MIPPWIGPLIGLISLSLAVTFFILARRARLKRPTWAVRSNNLVRGFASRLPDLEILFRNKKVDTVTVTRIAFWNRGLATIDRNDIAAADPLRIAPHGGTRLLDVRVVQVSGESSRFEAALDGEGKAAYLRFDFLDRDHGAVVQIVHTGASSDDLSVVGTIKGAGTPVRRTTRGAYLPLPTPIEFDRRIKPVTRRLVVLACEVTTLLALVVVLSVLLVRWLYPLQWAPIPQMWVTFEKKHWLLGNLLEWVGTIFAYTCVFILLRVPLMRPMLPVGLMSLVDDPLDP